MLSLIDYIVLDMIASKGRDPDDNIASISTPNLNVGIKKKIHEIQQDLGFKYYESFEKPMIALCVCASFTDGANKNVENHKVIYEMVDKLKHTYKKKFTKKIIDKQPMSFLELKPYLNMINPHYYSVLDYFIWSSMLGSEDLTDNQKEFMRNWKTYQKERLLLTDEACPKKNQNA